MHGGVVHIAPDRRIDIVLRPDRAIGEADLAAAPRLAPCRALAVEQSERAIALIKCESGRSPRERRNLAAGSERGKDFIRDDVDVGGHIGSSRLVGAYALSNTQRKHSQGYLACDTATGTGAGPYDSCAASKIEADLRNDHRVVVVR